MTYENLSNWFYSWKSCLKIHNYIDTLSNFLGLPRWLSGRESICQCRRLKFDSWVGKIPWRRKWQLTPIFLTGKIQWSEEPGGLQSMGSQRVRHDWAYTYMHLHQKSFLACSLKFFVLCHHIFFFFHTPAFIW